MKSVRAARQLRILIEAVPDPVPGQAHPSNSTWGRFLAAIEEHRPEMLPVFSQLLGPEAAEFTVGMTRSAYGHTEAEARALGYAMAHPDATMSTLVVKDTRDDVSE